MSEKTGQNAMTMKQICVRLEAWGATLTEDAGALTIDTPDGTRKAWKANGLHCYVVPLEDDLGRVQRKAALEGLLEAAEMGVEYCFWVPARTYDVRLLDGTPAQLWSDTGATLHFGQGFSEQCESTAAMLAGSVWVDSLIDLAAAASDPADKAKAQAAVDLADPDHVLGAPKGGGGNGTLR